MNSKTYRADKVVTLKDAGIKLANGDKDLEAELLDTLQRWPYYDNWEVTLRLKKGHLASEVLLGAAVSFLEGEGFELDEAWPRLELRQTTVKGFSEEVLYLAKILNRWDGSAPATWSTVKREVVKRMKAGDQTPFDFLDKDKTLIAQRGRDEEIAQKTFQNWLTSAKKVPRDS